MICSTPRRCRFAALLASTVAVAILDVGCTSPGVCDHEPGKHITPAAENPMDAKLPAKAKAKKPKKPAEKVSIYTKAYYKVRDVPSLPRVLLIGDSISEGYTHPTRQLLKGKANVHRIRKNGRSTVAGLAFIDGWLGKRKWDLIHFNFGLHDLAYVRLKDDLCVVGNNQVPPKMYERNLRELVAKLKATGAKLLWASSTPIAEGAWGSSPADMLKYNRIAARIMDENNIPTDDLYAFALKRLKDIQLPKNVHFSEKGSGVLAQQVAANILRELGSPAPAAGKPAR